MDLWSRSYRVSFSLFFLGFFGSICALCHEYSKLSPDLEKLQGVKGKIKLSSKFSKAVSGIFPLLPIEVCTQ